MAGPYLQDECSECSEGSRLDGGRRNMDRAVQGGGGRATNHGFEDGHQSPGLLETCCAESAAAARDVL